MNALSRYLAAVLCIAWSSFAIITPTHSGALASPVRTYAPRPTTAAPHLTYYGGNVMTSVKVDVVVWSSWSYSSAVPLAGPRSISSFFRGVTASRYFDWLTEYNTPTQNIGRGSFDKIYTLHPPRSANGARVTSAQIDSAMSAAFASGALPRPSANRLYAVFFRSGQVIARPEGDSAHDFCAYHDTISTTLGTAYFAVVPYEVSSRGCRPATSTFDNVTTIVSHELIESVTDPGVGLRRLSWYDRNNGEIGDICAFSSRPAPVTGSDGARYVVQREWSNRARACIVTH